MLDVVLPLPSWPYELSPQHRTVPFSISAHAWWMPTSTALTPLILLVTLFNSRRRTLHDYLTGTVLINDEARAASLRR